MLLLQNLYLHANQNEQLNISYEQFVNENFVICYNNESYEKFSEQNISEVKTNNREYFINLRWNANYFVDSTGNA